MSMARPPYASEFCERMVELARSGRSPEELTLEFEPSVQSIRNWVSQADRDEGRPHGDLTSTEHEELRRPRCENRRLRSSPARDFGRASASPGGWLGPPDGLRFWRCALGRAASARRPPGGSLTDSARGVRPPSAGRRRHTCDVRAAALERLPAPQAKAGGQDRVGCRLARSPAPAACPECPPCRWRGRAALPAWNAARRWTWRNARPRPAPAQAHKPADRPSERPSALPGPPPPHGSKSPASAWQARTLSALDLPLTIDPGDLRPPSSEDISPVDIDAVVNAAKEDRP